MPAAVSSLYQTKITGLRPLLIESVDKGVSRSKSSSVQVFFRADDIGVPSRSFFRMMELFKTYRVPLCLAVVPAWLTNSRWQVIRRSVGDASLFCCHQHGWKHANHQLDGKKQEFGDSRSQEEIDYDLKRGRDRLAGILGDDFFPFFTPPWNRCGIKTLDSLKKFDFHGVSRSRNASPSAQPDLPDYPINVDLHTRKEQHQADAIHNLLAELEEASASGRIGIMLHHQRMNTHAFSLLEVLLQTTSTFKNLEKVSFRDFSS